MPRRQHPDRQLIRGSVVPHRRRCGKPGCHCAGGEQLHESVVLTYSERGKTKMVQLPDDQVAAVRAGTEAYRAEKARLEAQAADGLAALLNRLAQLRGRR